MGGQRNGRFVIPVKNTYKRSGLGIVHDQSNTGKTVYIEPVQVAQGVINPTPGRGAKGGMGS